MSTSLHQNTIRKDSTTLLPTHPPPPTPRPSPTALLHQPKPPTPPHHNNAHHPKPGHNHATHPPNPNEQPLLFTLPNELLLEILNTLDQPTLESLRRTSRVFLRALPDIYPGLFTRTLQGVHPWPVRRVWTLGGKQRGELGRLLARDCEFFKSFGGGGGDGGGELGPGAGAGVVGLEKGMMGGGREGGVVVGCGGRMLGLAKAWRYIACVDCGRIHPPRGMQTPLVGALKG